MVLTIRDQHGKEIARRLVGVGALHPGEQRAFTLNVEMVPVTDSDAMARKTKH